MYSLTCFHTKKIHILIVFLPILINEVLYYYELCKIPMQSEQNGPARLPDGGLNDGTTNNLIMAQQSFDTKEIHFIHHLK